MVVSRGGSIGLADRDTARNASGAGVGTGGLEWDAEIVPGGDLIALNDAVTLWFVRQAPSIARFAPEPIMSLVGAARNQLMTMDRAGIVQQWDLYRDRLRHQPAPWLIVTSPSRNGPSSFPTSRTGPPAKPQTDRAVRTFPVRPSAVIDLGRDRPRQPPHGAGRLPVPVRNVRYRRRPVDGRRVDPGIPQDEPLSAQVRRALTPVPQPFGFEPIGQLVDLIGEDVPRDSATDHPHPEGGKNPAGRFQQALDGRPARDRSSAATLPLCLPDGSVEVDPDVTGHIPMAFFRSTVTLSIAIVGLLAFAAGAAFIT